MFRYTNINLYDLVHSYGCVRALLDMLKVISNIGFAVCYVKIIQSYDVDFLHMDRQS